MAQSRLEKVGTIFTRVQGLLRAGAMKPMDKPLWYDVYETFPPKLEPRFDRPAPDMKIRDIFYEEDIVRAKYHKSVKQVEMVGLNNKKESSTQQFIQIYNDLKAQGALDEEQIFNTAKDILMERRKPTQWEATETAELESETKINLMSDFKEAQENWKTKQNTEAKTTPKQTKKPLDIKTLFED
ncbi:probable 28S ribosomal protein S23, mitochondrial [Teleopsis dalmanni]|uniref:probable 28S ribosomal protein S23, mitochondrial n=1 Tax=Teleopsis dalmanni TaxID=139649 RepID=UPI0018CDD4D2|nr:probable 28S ribosomal protein S23, mitochondrial [Teleopsis dalmanni]